MMKNMKADLDSPAGCRKKRRIEETSPQSPKQPREPTDGKKDNDPTQSPPPPIANLPEDTPPVQGSAKRGRGRPPKPAASAPEPLSPQLMKKPDAVDDDYVTGQGNKLPASTPGVPLAPAPSAPKDAPAAPSPPFQSAAVVEEDKKKESSSEGPDLPKSIGSGSLEEPLGAGKEDGSISGDKAAEGPAVAPPPEQAAAQDEPAAPAAPAQAQDEQPAEAEAAPAPAEPRCRGRLSQAEEQAQARLEAARPEICNLLLWVIGKKIWQGMTVHPKRNALTNRRKVFFPDFKMAWANTFFENFFDGHTVRTEFKGKRGKSVHVLLEGDAIARVFGRYSVRSFGSEYAEMKSPVKIQVTMRAGLDAGTCFFAVYYCYGVFNAEGVEQWTGSFASSTIDQLSGSAADILGLRPGDEDGSSDEDGPPAAARTWKVPPPGTSSQLVKRCGASWHWDMPGAEGGISDSKI